MQPPVDLSIEWAPDNDQGSLAFQLSGHIRASIVNKQLVSGDRLPAARKLALELGISRGTVTTAIEQLVAEGVLESQMGSGVFVSPDAQWTEKKTSTLSAAFVRLPVELPVPGIDGDEPCRIDFRPCRPSVAEFPVSQWRRCMAGISGAGPIADYGDPRGDRNLRQSISTYLRRARGLNASTDEIIITNGAVHAMHLLASLFLDGSSQVIVEDPGYPLARQTFELAGANILPLPVDDDGLIVDALPVNPQQVRFVYVTPSHQFPTGSRLALGRRRALIEWAQRHKVVIVEDDYDGEFRFDVAPLAPMAAMDNNCVVYCGTFSKCLFPGLRMGYAVAPKPLINVMARYRLMSEYAPNAPVQQGLAQFIDQGFFEKHILRMRRAYGAKRRVVEQSVARHFPGSHLYGLQSGLHVVADLGEGIHAKDISERAKERGILVNPMERYGYANSNSKSALVIGYAASSGHEIEQGIEGFLP
ncbi:MAG: PLP-dependent aminotransferase family protein [Lysobacterales bacterium]